MAQDKEESKRIEKTDHKVEDFLSAELSSRGLGDFKYKDNEELRVEEQAMTSKPDISVRERGKDDRFIILASSGVWDCLTNKEMLNKIEEYIDEHFDEPYSKK